MKQLKNLLWVLILVVCTLVFASCDARTVTRVYVNDELHAIVEYSDGTTEDLGYVGVEVEKEVEKESEKVVEVLPPKYTVTFLDAFGQVLKTEKVYKGDEATPPEAPEIDEKSFDRWDTDLSAVTGDLTVRPIYTAAAQYTVTFLDETGTIIATDTVVHGKAATAPQAPLRADTIFKEWDTAFDCVKSNLIVRAVYRAKNTYTVTFKDYTGVVLGTATAKETGSVTSPVTPSRAGYTFAGWSSSLSNITSDKTVTAKYTLIDGANLLDYEYTVKNDGTVEMIVSVKGSVSFAALQASITIPGGTTVVSTEGLAGAVANTANGVCRISYFTVQNTTAKVNIVKLVLRPSSAATTLTFNMTVEKMVDSNTTPVTYTFIGDTLKLK